MVGRFVILVGGAALLAAVIGPSDSRTLQAQPPQFERRRPTDPGRNAPTGGPNTVRQGFPAAQFDPENIAKSETAWEIEWDLTHPMNRPFYPPGSTFRIRSAKYMWKDKYGKPQWITVVRNLELAEIYVPYDSGYMAFLDIHDMSFHTTPARKEYLGPNCVAPGELLSSSNPYWNNTIHKEIHDDGVRWMSAETSGRNEIADRVRRGEKMLLWSTYYGANYRYLLEFGFGDDGMLSARIGPTGRNILDRQDDKSDVHLHIGCWRMEFDLGDPVNKVGGPKDTDILLARRVFDETTEKFAQVARPFAHNARGQACEGAARWEPEEFTQIRAQSKVRKSGHGRPMCYDLIPQRIGALRKLQGHYNTEAALMDAMNYDFWVTRTEPTFTSFIDVPTYAKDKRPLESQPTTVWHCAPVLHFPRGEDFGTDGGKNSMTGLAITFWTGFYLKPRDILDATPLYQPTPPRRRAEIFSTQEQ
jgi:primary-amine oxidase